MPRTNAPPDADVSLPPGFESLEWRTIALRELTEHKSAEIKLRAALEQNQLLLREKDELIRQQEMLNQECYHRLLNNLQMIFSLLSLQSRKEENPETAERLSVAANRVGAIAGLHRHLHSMAGTPTVEFRKYLDELCRGHSTMSMSEHRPDLHIVVEGTEISLSTTTGIPLSLIVNELVTNAIKHGIGRITVKLEARPGEGHALSVCNEGSTLPEAFDPAACTGVGMSLVTSLVQQIGAELRIDRGEDDQSTRFAVLFT